MSLPLYEQRNTVITGLGYITFGRVCTLDAKIERITVIADTASGVSRYALNGFLSLLFGIGLYLTGIETI